VIGCATTTIEELQRMRSRRIAAFAGTGGVTALIGALALAPGAPAEPTALAAATCTPVSNIQAIIDDSGSMAGTDDGKLRVAALRLLIDTPGNEQITLGAVEFGGSFDPADPTIAATLFPPQPIGANADAMKAALVAAINADNGTTDYNAAFARALADNPNAKARIFLTDGGHNGDDYANGHQGGPPTYVIGFSSATAGTDGLRLQQIASDTGGRYFAATDASNLQAVMNEVGTTLTCQSPPKTFNDVLAAGQAKPHAVKLASRARSAQLTLSWSSPLDSFTVTKVRIVRRGKVVAVAAARKRKLRLTTRRGDTFLVVKVGRLTKGSLRFKVHATRVGSGAPSVSLTTQVTQSRRK
jgi:hypothetical protein